METSYYKERIYNHVVSQLVNSLIKVKSTFKTRHVGAFPEIPRISVSKHIRDYRMYQQMALDLQAGDRFYIGIIMEANLLTMK